ncbi:TetR/AcrR family transcriptional regulator [Kineosporia mesophila]|uniref:TetR/AcrR family transcriptional regulator n=1 Tax=Kineosporia mesophila TaxID=566012 RepID=A0ABP6ZB57_9ACTN|nr:TetR/AcrR family transcriptional regulator [Kineosporia mesophila]
MPPQQRADARRNYERLLAVAVEAVAEHGASASREQIGRTAGVGSGTVRRHFPTRHALLDAVFHDQVEGLAARAADLADAPDPRAALLDWLGALTTYAATFKGLAEALVQQTGSPDTYCSTGRLTAAGAPLVQRAGPWLAPGVTIEGLIDLITGIALVAERYGDPPAHAARMWDLTVRGISPA